MDTPLQGGHCEAMLFFARLRFKLNKVMLHFQPVLTTAFFKWHLISSCPQCPPTTIQLETHLKRGMRGRGVGKWMSGVLEACVRGSDARAAHLSPATTHNCLQVFVAVCVSHSTWLVTVRVKVWHIFPTLRPSRVVRQECQCGVVSSVLVKHLVNLFSQTFQTDWSYFHSLILALLFL